MALKQSDAGAIRQLNQSVASIRGQRHAACRFWDIGHLRKVLAEEAQRGTRIRKACVAALASPDEIDQERRGAATKTLKPMAMSSSRIGYPYHGAPWESKLPGARGS